MVLDLGEEELPITLAVKSEGGLSVDFMNSTEVITAYEYSESGDSLYLRMPLFDSEFCGVVSEDRNTFSGVWKNYVKDDYSIPFTAYSGDQQRFKSTNTGVDSVNLYGQYQVHFSPETDDYYPAIGLFDIDSTTNIVSGTFATETGDYRYLAGSKEGDHLLLSCFDGSHAFLFKADIVGDSLVNGVFKSGTHWTEPWVAVQDPSFTLRDPNTLTIIKDSSQVWSTRLQDKAGEDHRLSELELEGKVVILQVMGSWCPNCIDESLAYKEFYDKYHERGLDIIPVAFEKSADPETIKEVLEELEEDLDLPYNIYFGGKKSKAAAAEALPALNHVMSYPTSIFIDRSGAVRKVHTGFYGPSTKHFYDMWLHDTEMLIEELLDEV